MRAAKMEAVNLVPGYSFGNNFEDSGFAKIDHFKANLDQDCPTPQKEDPVAVAPKVDRQTAKVTAQETPKPAKDAKNQV